MEQYTNPIDKFRHSPEAAALSNQEYLRQLIELKKQEDATNEVTEPDTSSVTPTPKEEFPILDDAELLKRSNRKGILKDVPIENALEKRILSGWRLPESDSDPYFRGMRQSEISDMRRMQRVVLGEEQVNPVAEEASRALAGGVLTTLDSVFSPHLVDMVSGKMEAEGDNYEPDWSFSKQFDIEYPILNTAWGPYLESIFHYGTLGLGIVSAISASPFTLPVIGKGGAFGKFATGTTQGMIIGAGQDAVSIRSHEQNASRMLIDRYPQLDRLVGPLATQDSDSPLAIYFKNVAEGIGFEALLGGTWELLGQGLSAAKRSKFKAQVSESTLSKLKDRFDQTKAKGKVEFDEQDGFVRTITDLEQNQIPGEIVDLDGMPPSPYMGLRGHKNKGAVDPWQGSPNSRAITPYDNFNNLNKIDKSEPYGSVDSILTALEAEDFATNGFIANKGVFNRIRDKIINDPRFQTILKKAKVQGKSTYATFKASLDRYQDIAGLNFKKPRVDFQDFFKRTGLTVNDVIASETIINSLFKQIRDVATAAREVKKMGGDIFAVDGPMKTIADRLTAAIEMSNYHRVAAHSSVKDANKALKGIHEESLGGVHLLMNFLDREAPQELIDEVLKFLSTAHRSGKISDFNNWMRQKMTGGDMLPGKNKQGALLQEVSTMHINSMFGPKTAQRAIWGTGFNSYLNQFHDTFGAALRYPITRDSKQFKAQFASFMSMIDFIPDAWKIFKGNINEAFKDGAVIDTRFSQYGQRQFNDEAYSQWLELEGSESDKIVWNLWQTAKNLNGNSTIGKAASAVSRVMDAGDRTFEELVRHRRVKEIAMRDALNAKEAGDITQITDEVLDAAGDLYERKYYNEAGDLDLRREAFTKNDFDEVTYRTELQGASKAFAEFINQVPLLKPYFRFIRSGINGLTLKTKGMPILAGLVDKERAIALAQPGDLSKVRKYGIETDWDLEKVKARQWSRQAVGYGLVYIAIQKYLSGELSGNGPANQGMRNVWVDSGWERNMIGFGNKRVSIELFERFDLLLKGVADVGDNLELMGPEWAEDKLRAFAVATAFTEAATNQTYLSSVGDIADTLRGEPGSVNRLVGTLANVVPFGGWRRWLGDSLTNAYREINSSIWSERGFLESGPAQTIRRSNLATEFLAPLTGNQPLPYKYNILNGEPFDNRNVLGRLFRATSMVNISPAPSPGQKLLWNSNYDLRASTWYSPGTDRVSLKDNAELRSEFEKQMGLVKINGRNLEQWLNHIAKDPRVLASVKEMNNDRKKGEIEYDPTKAYYHNRLIRKRFEETRKIAWSRVRILPSAKRLIKEKQALDAKTKAKLDRTTHQELEPVLNMTK